IPQVAPMVRDLVTSRARSRTHLRYADVRLEAIEGKYAAAENGDSKGAGEDVIMGFGVRVLAGDGMIAPGYFGRALGEADIPQLARELFASSEGALIDQASALTQGMCYVVANGDGNSQQIYDVVGHQRGWEILLHGVNDPLMSFPPFPEFALAIARDAVELCEAPTLPSPAGEVTVVTDPHYHTLVSNEIIGHPVELDRGRKMDTAYAGR